MWCQLSSTILTSGAKAEDLIMRNTTELTWEMGKDLMLLAADYS